MAKKKKKPQGPAPSVPVVPPSGETVVAMAVLPEHDYIRERDGTYDVELKSAETHDKAILELAMAALGISITFLDSIAPDPQPWTLNILLFAWASLVVSIIAILGSHLLSQKSCRRQRELYDLEQLTQEVPDQTNVFADWTVYTTYTSHLCFILGVIALTVFTGINVKYSKGEAATSEHNPNIPRVEQDARALGHKDPEQSKIRKRDAIEGSTSTVPLTTPKT